MLDAVVSVRLYASGFFRRVGGHETLVTHIRFGQSSVKVEHSPLRPRNLTVGRRARYPFVGAECTCGRYAAHQKTAPGLLAHGRASFLFGNNALKMPGYVLLH